MPKKDYHKEMNKLMGQVKVNFQKFGKNAEVVAKKGEKELVRASKIGKLQLDIMGMNIQKEKVYYEMGKKIASMRGKETDVQGIIEPYLKELRKIESESRNRKREISQVKKTYSKK